MANERIELMWGPMDGMVIDSLGMQGRICVTRGFFVHDGEQHAYHTIIAFYARTRDPGIYMWTGEHIVSEYEYTPEEWANVKAKGDG